jgi:membrane protease YdiL (CAAX protease family)
MNAGDVILLAAVGAVVSATVYVQYKPAARVALRWARAIAPHFARSVPTAQVTSVVALILSGTSGIVLAGVMILAAGTPLLGLFGEHLTPELLLLGVGLGVAEAALSLLLASSAMAATIPLRFAQLGREAGFELAIVGRGGWIRSYSHALNLLPIPLALTVILLPLAAEEMLFRGMALTFLRPTGPLVAILGSTMLFIAVQFTGMPSWFSALPAACGAIVVGLVHGYLFWSVPTLVPLLIAHLVYFLFVAL